MMVLQRGQGLREKGQEGSFGDAADFLGGLHFLIRKVGDSFIFFLNLSHHAMLTN